MKKQTSGLFLMTLAAMLATLILGIAPGCKTGSSSNTTGTTTQASGVSFSRDIQPIFNSYCVVCHAGAGQAGLTLEPASAYSNLVGVPSTESTNGELRVKAGTPDQSYLLAKVNGTQIAAGGKGGQMPLGATPLSAAQISLIQQWIAAGAPNN
jgi:cytochrome c553